MTRPSTARTSRRSRSRSTRARSWSGSRRRSRPQTGHVGFIGAVPIPLIEKFEAGFTAGARAVAPDIDGRDGVPLAAAGLLGLRGPGARQGGGPGPCTTPGADVVFAAAGGSGFGRHRGGRQRRARGPSAWTRTCGRQVGDALKPHVLTSMLKNADLGTYTFVRAVADGTFLPGSPRLRHRRGRRGLRPVGRLPRRHRAADRRLGGAHRVGRGRRARGPGRPLTAPPRRRRRHDPAAHRAARDRAAIPGCRREPRRRPRRRRGHDPRDRGRERRRQVDADAHPLRDAPRPDARRDAHPRARRSGCAPRPTRSPAASAWSTSTSSWPTT